MVVEWFACHGRSNAELHGRFVSQIIRGYDNERQFYKTLAADAVKREEKG